MNMASQKSKNPMLPIFVNVGGKEFHIGYDHRGTNIEIKIPGKFNYNTDVNDTEAQICFEALKKLVDLYKQKAS